MWVDYLKKIVTVEPAPEAMPTLMLGHKKKPHGHRVLVRLSCGHVIEMQSRKAKNRKSVACPKCELSDELGEEIV